VLRRSASLSLLALVTSGVVLLSGCTSSPDGGDRDEEAVRTATPGRAVTVLDQASPAARALAASTTFFEHAPVVVLAPVDDVAARQEAVDRADGWGVPVLLDETPGHADGADTGEAGGAGPDPADETATAPATASAPEGTPSTGAPSTSDDALVTELERLGAVTVATVGDVALDGAAGLTVAPASEVAQEELPTQVPQGTAARVLTTATESGGAAAATARAAGAEVSALAEGDADPRTAEGVQALAGAGDAPVVLIGADFAGASGLEGAVASARTGVELPGGGQLVFDDRRYVALYGAPSSPVLGVLGEQGPEAAAQRAAQLTSEYAGLTSEAVVPMMEIIATVAAGDAGPDGDYSNELPVDQLLPYVEAAEAAGQYVVIDLQPGRTDFLTQAKRYEELLRRPGVGLALDPEWRLAPDQVHLRQIGGVDAAEVDAVSDWLADLVRTEALPQKMFVLHQFRASMLRDRASLDVSHPELATVVHVDGQGSQPDKQATWSFLHEDAPAGIHWGWKNFYDEDEPMLTPQQTMAHVSPVPDIVTYQ